jgi:hypothetical protein
MLAAEATIRAAKAVPIARVDRRRSSRNTPRQSLTKSRLLPRAQIVEPALHCGSVVCGHVGKAASKARDFAIEGCGEACAEERRLGVGGMAGAHRAAHCKTAAPWPVRSIAPLSSDRVTVGIDSPSFSESSRTRRYNSFGILTVSVEFSLGSGLRRI